MDDNRYKHPTNSMWGAFCNRLLNNQTILGIRRGLFKYLPFLTLKSDVTDVVYMNWLVDVEAFKNYIPKDVVIYEKQGRALFTILTYKHHHFGPILLGPLRLLFGSPLQSNWRLYVDRLPNSTKNEQGIVLFLKNIFNSTFFAMSSRISSDALPSHLSDSFALIKKSTGYEIEITAGEGSAPSLAANLLDVGEQNGLPHEFHEYFGGIRPALDFICLQDSAICSIGATNAIAQAGIDLPVDIATIKPLQLTSHHIDFLEKLGANPSPAFCFVVPNIAFKALWEKIL